MVFSDEYKIGSTKIISYIEIEKQYYNIILKGIQN